MYTRQNHMWDYILDSNNFSIGIHFFKVLVQIHYSRSPCPLIYIKTSKIIKNKIKMDRIGLFNRTFLLEIARHDHLPVKSPKSVIFIIKMQFQCTHAPISNVGP